MERNYYHILKVRPSSTQEEIKKSYRKLAKKFHPDVNKGRVEYEEAFKLINNAYEVLGDSEKRREYDNKIYLQDLSKKRAGQQQSKQAPNPTPEPESPHYSYTKANQYEYKKQPRRYRAFRFDGINIGVFLVASCVIPLLKVCVRNSNSERPFPHGEKVVVGSIGGERKAANSEAGKDGKISKGKSASAPDIKNYSSAASESPAKREQDQSEIPNDRNTELSHRDELLTDETSTNENTSLNESGDDSLTKVQSAPKAEENTLFDAIVNCGQEDQECYRLADLGIEKFTSPDRLGLAYFVGFIARYNLEKTDETMQFFERMMMYHQEGSIQLKPSYLAQVYRAALLLSVILNNSDYYYSLRDSAIYYGEDFPEYLSGIQDSIDMAEKSKGWLAH